MTRNPGEWALRFTGPGAFLGRGATEADRRWIAEQEGGRWESSEGADACRVRRGPGGGTLTLEEEGGEPAVASTPDPLGETGGVYYLLLADGRLFRLAPRGTRPGGYELTGWDTPGPYLIARPDSVGWNLETQPAGMDLEGLRTLIVLVATRIVEEEDRTGGNEP